MKQTKMIMAQEYLKQYDKILNEMVTKMENSPRCININLNFVNEMIPHHEGAVQMCKNLLKYPIDPRLKNIAETIIKEQTRGIEQLTQVRQRLCQMR